MTQILLTVPNGYIFLLLALRFFVNYSVTYLKTMVRMVRIQRFLMYQFHGESKKQFSSEGEGKVYYEERRIRTRKAECSSEQKEKNKSFPVRHLRRCSPT